MPTRTAAAHRAEQRVVYDAFVAACPTRQLLDRLGSKWVSLLLSALADGPRRHSQLARQVAGVTPKMLTQTLRALEADGLVTREVTAQVPVRVDYALTPLGRSLLPVLAALRAWAEQHMDEVHEARARWTGRREATGAPDRG